MCSSRYLSNRKLMCICEASCLRTSINPPAWETDPTQVWDQKRGRENHADINNVQKHPLKPTLQLSKTASKAQSHSINVCPKRQPTPRHTQRSLQQTGSTLPHRVQLARDVWDRHCLVESSSPSPCHTCQHIQVSQARLGLQPVTFSISSKTLSIGVTKVKSVSSL